MDAAPTHQSAPHARLSGRHALVTGGGRGIGLSIARALAQAGAQVTVLGRDMGSQHLFIDLIASDQRDIGDDRLARGRIVGPDHRDAKVAFFIEQCPQRPMIGLVSQVSEAIKALIDQC